MEVGAHSRNLLLQHKAERGWLIGKIKDYLVANRCSKCSRFNHRFCECRGEEACFLCAGSHKLKECAASPTAYKCFTCQTHKHNQHKNICDNPSSLDKKCSSLQAILEKYRQHGLLKLGATVTSTQNTAIERTKCKYRLICSILS